MKPFKLICICLSVLFFIDTALAALEAESMDEGNLKVINSFLVSIQLDIFPICGGGIIDENHILTAAQCVTYENGRFLNFSYNIKVLSEDLSDINSGFTIAVDKIYILKSMSVESNNNDIAVLKLKESLDLGDNSLLKKLSLPPANFSEIDQITVFAGYGWHTHHDIYSQIINQSDNKLRFTEAKILSKNKCKNIIKRTMNTELCAKIIHHEDETSASRKCIGRTGNPLIIDEIVVGILESTSLSCTALEDVYEFTKVSPFLDFINNAMNDIVTDDMSVYICPS